MCSIYSSPPKSQPSNHTPFPPHSHPQTTYKQSIPTHTPITHHYPHFTLLVHNRTTLLYQQNQPITLFSTKSHNLTFITPKFNIQTKSNPLQSSLTPLTTSPSIKNSPIFYLISLTT